MKVDAPPASVAGPNPPVALYVGDLAPTVNASKLFSLFSSVAPVASVHICRDSLTRQSMGYAYVNFHSHEDADRVMNHLNYYKIDDRPCRIMWKQQNSNLRRSGEGNVIVKNLKKSITAKELHDTFSLIGDILSCKVALDETGSSKGYGFVHFATQAQADAAIKKVNGMEVEGQTVEVERFVPRDVRSKDNWSNVYVKNFPPKWTKEDVVREFSPFGEVKSVAVSESSDITTKDGKVMKFAFVAYDSHEAAAAAVEKLHEKEYQVEEKSEEKDENETVTYKLYVGRAMKKAERSRALKKMKEEKRGELIKKLKVSMLCFAKPLSSPPQHLVQNKNLYVRNLDESVTEEDLMKLFREAGNVTSVRIPKRDGRSRLFGYVCFDTEEEAQDALNRFNNKLFREKPLHVNMWVPKEQRIKLQRHNNMRNRKCNVHYLHTFPANAYFF